MRYQITARNHLILIRKLLLLGLAFIAPGLYVLIEAHNAEFLAFMAISFCILYLIPQAILHLEYYLKNKHTIVDIDTDKQIISVNNKPLKFDDIDHVNIYMSRNLDGVAGGMYPGEDYWYTKFKLKNGKVIFFTCLLLPDYNEFLHIFHKQHFITKYRIYPSLYMERTDLYYIFYD